MSEPIRYNVVTLQPGAIVELETCVLVAVTSDGQTLHLGISGEGLLALPKQVHNLLQKCPDIARWRSVSRQ